MSRRLCRSNFAAPVICAVIAFVIDATAAGASAAAQMKAPSNTSAVGVSESRADVSWQDNSTNEAGFEVHRSTAGPTGSFSVWATTAANTTNYADEGIAASTQYCYKLRAFARQAAGHVTLTSRLRLARRPRRPRHRRTHPRTPPRSRYPRAGRTCPGRTTRRTRWDSKFIVERPGRAARIASW